MAMSILNQLLHRAVDYAGLFPPAALPFEQVVHDYRQYQSSKQQAWLGRLVVPAGRLEELATLYQGITPAENPSSPWLISALLPPISAADDGFETALRCIEKFHQQHTFARVDTIEGKLAAPGQAQETLRAIPHDIDAFLEIPFAEPDVLIEELAACHASHAFAKIRTGGVTEDLIPTTERVAHFLDHCARSGIGLKATAGLHHPLRALQPLTYAEDAPRAVMHGFVNVFLAACLAFQQRTTVTELTQLLDETDPDAFRLEPTALHWRDRCLDQQAIQNARERFLISFGSCSFTEPVTDLQHLNWLPRTDHAGTADTP